MTGVLFESIVLGWIVIGFVVFIVLLFVTAPYGRHSKSGWGLMIPNRVGWILMEIPSLLVFSYFFLFREGRIEPVTWIFFGLYAAHYINRSLIYPFRIRTSGKKMPMIIAVFAIFFNLVNGSLNGLYFSRFSPEYGPDWFMDIRFILGLLLFIGGAVINLRADNYLIRLRRNAVNGYKIPEGGLFNLVSCPNFLGEIIEWTGFAIMTWSPAALAFALWTAFNLLPRGIEHHKWYHTQFTDYPSSRKAVLPYLI